ncbi:hypothetical protein ANCDUO_27581, partial [Ancylostoma duodenale]
MKQWHSCTPDEWCAAGTNSLEQRAVPQIKYQLFSYSYSILVTYIYRNSRSVTDPRSGKRVALKKMPNVFQNLASCKRVFREIRMLSSFKHDN